MAPICSDGVYDAKKIYVARMHLGHFPIEEFSGGIAIPQARS